MSPVRMSKVESAMRLALAFHTAFNRRDVAAIIAILSADCVFEQASPAPDGTTYVGKAAIAAFWHAFFDDVAHCHLEIEALVGLGERCVLRWQFGWVGTNGVKRHVRGVDIFRVVDNLICEQFSYVKG